MQGEMRTAALNLVGSVRAGMSGEGWGWEMWERRLGGVLVLFSYCMGRLWRW